MEQLILLDLSAAFDTVNHEILLARLEELGLHDSALKLMASFLKDRSFSEKLGEYTSDSFKSPCGVPQGSSLSPTLFNVYVASLAEIIRQCGFMSVLYANDTQIVVSVTGNVEDTAVRFNECMAQVGHWMQ